MQSLQVSVWDNVSGPNVSHQWHFGDWCGARAESASMAVARHALSGDLWAPDPNHVESRLHVLPTFQTQSFSTIFHARLRGELANLIESSVLRLVFTLRALLNNCPSDQVAAAFFPEVEIICTPLIDVIESIYGTPKSVSPVSSLLSFPPNFELLLTSHLQTNSFTVFLCPSAPAVAMATDLAVTIATLSPHPLTVSVTPRSSFTPGLHLQILQVPRGSQVPRHHSLSVPRGILESEHPTTYAWLDGGITGVKQTPLMHEYGAVRREYVNKRIGRIVKGEEEEVKVSVRSSSNSSNINGNIMASLSPQRSTPTHTQAQGGDRERAERGDALLRNVARPAPLIATMMKKCVECPMVAEVVVEATMAQIERLAVVLVRCVEAEARIRQPNVPTTASSNASPVNVVEEESTTPRAAAAAAASPVTDTVTAVVGALGAALGAAIGEISAPATPAASFSSTPARVAAPSVLPTLDAATVRRIRADMGITSVADFAIVLAAAERLHAGIYVACAGDPGTVEAEFFPLFEAF